MAPLLAKVSLPWQRLKASYIIPRTRTQVGRFLYRLLAFLPLPAQDKWNGSLQLFRLHAHLLFQLALERYGRQDAHMLVSESLYEAGKALAQKRSLQPSPAISAVQLISDTYGIALKTLNLPSVTTVEQGKVRVATFFCPFLEDARKSMEDPWDVCQRICGEHRSLFKGLSDGFPFRVHYSAPMMMGRGSKFCIKELAPLETSTRD